MAREVGKISDREVRFLESITVTESEIRAINLATTGSACIVKIGAGLYNLRFPPYSMRKVSFR